MHALDEPIGAHPASTKGRGAIEEHARRQASDRQHDRQHEADRDYLPQLHPNVEAAERTDQGPAQLRRRGLPVLPLELAFTPTPPSAGGRARLALR